MTHMRLWAAAAIIAVVVVVGFILSVPRARDDGRLSGMEKTSPIIPIVALSDTYKKGVHTITGEVNVQNVCSQVNAVASVVGDAANPEGITVAITVTGSDDVCLQLPTSLSFSTTISAPPDVPLTATINGSFATTTAP